MTLIVIAHTGKTIEGYADSLISGNTPMIDSGAKLMSLPVRVYDTEHSEVFSGSFGFAFAGSTLIAQAVFGFASAMLVNLVQSDDEMPSLEDFAILVQSTMESVKADLEAKIKSPTRQQTEVSLFGFCPVLKKLLAYLVVPKDDPRFSGNGVISANLKPLGSKGGGALVLGDHAAMAELIKRARGAVKPLHDAFFEAINDSKMKTVGGDLQIITASEKGAKVVPIAYLNSQQEWKMRLFNHDITNIRVGSCTAFMQFKGLGDPPETKEIVVGGVPTWVSD